MFTYLFLVISRIKNKKILIVDDDITTIKILSSLLSEFQPQLEFASSGDEAIKKVQASLPDLILLDILMPEKNGFETCQEILEIDGGQDIPILFVSGSQTTHLTEAYLNSGAVDYINKPFNKRDLIIRIENHLKLHELLKFQKESQSLIREKKEIAELKNKELESLSDQLSKYVSPQIYQNIINSIDIKKQKRVNPTRKQLTIFFSDICHFTELSDNLEPETLSDFVNEYFNEMAKIALQYGATIDKFMGDAVMAFFGDPHSDGPKQDALNCVRMSLAMRDQITVLAKKWNPSGFCKPLQVRMGIHTGFCTIGNFGSDERMDYTIIGNPVNLASRIESNAVPDQILITHSTYSLVSDFVYCRNVKVIEAKGIKEPVKVYEIVDYNDKIKNPKYPLIKFIRDKVSSKQIENLSFEELQKMQKMLQKSE